MKQLIKQYYQTPEVNRSILTAVLEKEKEKKKNLSLITLLTVSFFFLFLSLFGKHLLDFNINYFDISSTMISNISIPLFLL